MLLSFLMPYNIRNLEAPYLWVFYKQLSSFAEKDIIYIASEEYFYSKTYHAKNKRWELEETSCKSNKYELPSEEQIKMCIHYCINQEIFSSLEQKCSCCANIVFQKLLTERYTPLEEKLDYIVDDCVTKYGDVEAVVTWCNCPSLEYIAAKYGIRVIHNEWGPLRAPFYISTAYFDFSGVNGNTESYDRYRKFMSESGEVIIYSPDNILKILLLVANEYITSSTTYRIGVPLQVEDDSNMLAFSNGFNNVNLLTVVNRQFKRNNILVRKHPGGWFDYNKDSCGVVDKSENAIEFIGKCESIHTINSSVGFEALLYDKKIHIYGDSPFKYLQDISNKDELWGAMNFIVFGYLIPYSLLFDIEYYKWRLSKPAEKEIYNFHMKYYLQELNNRWEEKYNNIVEKYNNIERKCLELEYENKEIKNSRYYKFWKRLGELKNKLIGLI